MGLQSQKMNLDYIRTFVVLGQSKNMFEASKKLEVNASYVSRHLKHLEEELNTKLVIPTPKFKELKLTKEGQYFFEKYEKIYNEILLTEKEYKQRIKLDDCKITIGINAMLEKKYLMPKLEIFEKKFPHISIKIINEETEKLTKNLLQFKYDFILDKEIPKENKMIGIQSQKIASSNYCYIKNKEKFKNRKDIEKLPLIVPIRNKSERIQMENYFKEKGILPNIKYEMDNIDRVIDYVEAGFGVGIVLKDNLYISKNIESVDLDIPCEIYISYLPEKVMPTTLEFLKLFGISKDIT